jgi:D-alanyl-D-alanine carboxypeptidase/D-alanyl-D-alanine-endopeptidase (penicillin-binding protein 4)
VFLLPLGLLHGGTASASPAAALPAPVAQALRSAGIPPQAVSLHVQEVGSASPRLMHNAAQPMNPASTMKLLTTFAALELLGPAYTWKTEAHISGTIENGVLTGDLHLKGSGDPKLTVEQFWLLLRQMRGRGLREIRGDLVLDRSIFELPEHDAGQFDAQPLRPYNVGPDALLLNFKAIRITLRPDPNGAKVLLDTEPRLENLDVTNLIRQTGNGCGDWRENLRADVARHAERYRLILTGSFSTKCGEKVWNLGVLSHPHFVFGVFSQLWQEMGGSIQGSVREGPLPSRAKPMASIESPSLAEIVRDINKFSNNVMTRQLFLTVGKELGREPARIEDGDAVLRNWLDAKGLRFPELVIENGSGLSRRERISAENMGRLLQTIWKSPLMPEVLASLPLSAVDGTMKKRLNSNGVAGQAHVKTGSLEGVKAIAGYVLDKNGHQHSVVFFINHANAGVGQAAQDALLQWVYEGGAK